VSTSLEAKTSGAESNTAPVLEGAADLTESEDAEVQRMLACDYILLVIDGTWLQAREMFAATYAFLPPHHVVVTLETTNDELTQELADQPRLRSEPSRGCMLTIEAVAAALRILEGPESGMLRALATTRVYSYTCMYVSECAKRI
jgi:DTW domain-containing protein YfiP